MNVELTLESKDYPTSEELLTSMLPANHVFETIIEYNLREFNEAGWPDSKEAWVKIGQLLIDIFEEDLPGYPTHGGKAPGGPLDDRFRDEAPVEG